MSDEDEMKQLKRPRLDSEQSVEPSFSSKRPRLDSEKRDSTSDSTDGSSENCSTEESNDGGDHSTEELFIDVTDISNGEYSVDDSDYSTVYSSGDSDEISTGDSSIDDVEVSTVDPPVDGSNVSTGDSTESDGESFIYVNDIFETPLREEYDISEKIIHSSDGSVADDQQLIFIKCSDTTKFLNPKANGKRQTKEPEYLTYSDWFCQTECHLFYVDVDSLYLSEHNAEELYDNNYQALITGMQDDNSNSPENDQKISNGEYKSQHQAYSLYGTIHSKYLLTNDGLEAMKKNYLDGRYGVCLNPDCQFQRRIPCGRSKTLDIQHVVLYCPCCTKLYLPKELYRCVDGAHFGGIEFLSAFFGKFPELIDSKGPPPTPPRTPTPPSRPPSPDVPRPDDSQKKKPRSSEVSKKKKPKNSEGSKKKKP